MKPILCALALLLTAQAFNIDVDDPPDRLNTEQLQRLHGLMDRDSDGKVTLGELKGHKKDSEAFWAKRDASSVLDDLDIDGDGYVNEDELLSVNLLDPPCDDAKCHRQRENNRREHDLSFKHADEDGNQLLDEAELRYYYHTSHHEVIRLELTKAHAESRDKNKDGELSPAEFWGNAGYEDDDDPTDDEIDDVLMKDFKALDEDGNGKLSVQEANEWYNGRFMAHQDMTDLLATTDVDEDGVITQEEMTGSMFDEGRNNLAFNFIDWWTAAAQKGEL
eukprot:CAMPEP_0197659312 /NCGR_PEP_ID=MMETSP1338-20131121/47177_1 /TAXON_ID=43686 ORGANISM="Pelagodinium beii, Strain RCC1491" /NCGR_SAMPLE_ID=MMETSP1338 /ASSEMBLY_ACC=CAM_ASM_000754 /LENGTH=276 /DNA_ID=CAMNT_0043236181 /DNA_START=49 /DNA_END=879 /DNA_ORIENTATION=+